MFMKYLVAGAFSVGLTVLATCVVYGQDYPNKTIRIISSEPGGGSDLLARMIAQGLSESMGQPVVVENHPGGASIYGEIVNRAAPDGYTVLVSGSSVWQASLLRKTPYDPITGFSSITLVAMQPNILVLHPSLPVKSVKELIAFTKARPGELNYASAGSGSSNHIAGELFKSMAGVNMVHIPYSGSGPGVIALLSGQVQLMFSSTAAAMPHVKSGKLRALAVTSLQPSALVPDLPTIAATLPGYESTQLYGMLAPPKTAATIISRLNRDTVRFLTLPDTKKRLLNAGIETIASTPEELAAAIKSELTTISEVIKFANIHVEQ